MAGDWIKWVKGLGFRSEVLTVARMLNVHRGVVALACMELWEYADTETVDGNVVGASVDIIDAKVCLPGFSNALKSVGWMEETAEGVRLPDFERHNGKSAKLRAGKTKRQKNWRENVDAPVDTPAPTASSSREEKRIYKDTPAEPERSPFDDFWTAYPRKKSKGSAAKAWKVKGCGKITERIMAALSAAKASPDWTKDGGKWIPYPATWLNAEGWNDELPGITVKADDPRRALASEWLRSHPPEASVLLAELRRKTPIFATCTDDAIIGHPPREIIDEIERRREAA